MSHQVIYEERINCTEMRTTTQQHNPTSNPNDLRGTNKSNPDLSIISVAIQRLQNGKRPKSATQSNGLDALV
ncbi:hypothetical protein, partial [Lacinutrix undariae]